MYHAQLISSVIPDNWLVLDVGGWAQPFQRANKVIDCQPYQTRQLNNINFVGPSGQVYGEEDWIILDLEEEAPWGCPDKYFDLVLSGHTLEDLKNPLPALKQMFRVGKRVVIEVPSPFYELCKGIDPSHSHPGANHHHWIIVLEPSTNTLKCFQKRSDIMERLGLFLEVPANRMFLANSSKMNWRSTSLMFFSEEPQIQFITDEESLIQFYAQTIEDSKSVSLWDDSCPPKLVEDPFATSCHNL